MLLKRISSNLDRFGLAIDPREFSTPVSRIFSCSRKYASASTGLVEVGTFTPEHPPHQAYRKGQLFIHRIFAYRGIIVQHAECDVRTIINADGKKTRAERTPYYHVLIDTNDWSEMNFNYDLTTCLLSKGGSGNESKDFADLHGMDVAAHDEILPYEKEKLRGTKKSSSDLPPIQNPHYAQFFTGPVAAKLVALKDFASKAESDPIPLGKPDTSAILPRAVFKQRTNDVEVHVIPFYLGIYHKQGLPYNFWRCLFRLINHERGNKLTLTECHLHLSNEFHLHLLHEQQQQYREEEVVEEEEEQEDFDTDEYDDPEVDRPLWKADQQWELTAAKPATQFNALFVLSSDKGNNLHGHFQLENDKGKAIKLDIPQPILLDCEPR